MHKKTFSGVAVLIVTSSICAFSLLPFPSALQSRVRTVSERPVAGTTLLKQPQANAGVPIRLRIPSIQVDAAIESVGLTSKGAMDAPENPDNVGWYNLGPRPGERGSAVLAGHLDWYKGKTAVFQHLGELRVGNVLSVETSSGRFLPFVVRQIHTYSSDEYVPEVFQNVLGNHLNLVTCGGVWDTTRKIYRERLVVFTDEIVTK